MTLNGVTCHRGCMILMSMNRVAFGRKKNISFKMQSGPKAAFKQVIVLKLTQKKV